MSVFSPFHYYFYTFHINIRASPLSASIDYSFTYPLHFIVTSGTQLMAIWPYLPFFFSYVKELSCILNTSVFVLPLRCKSLYYMYRYFYSFIVVSIFHFQVLLIYFSVCSPTEVIYISFPVFRFSLQLLH